MKRVRSEAQEFQQRLIAALRADLHNTAGKSFDRLFEPAQFMPGGQSSVEQRARELMAQGIEPSRAVAMASITQSSKHRLFVVKSAMDAKKKPGTKPSRRAKPG